MTQSSYKHLRSTLLMLVGCGLIATSAATATPAFKVSLRDFGEGRHASFSLHGDAVVDGSRIRLTRSTNNLAGSAIFYEPIQLAHDRSFSAYFTFRMTPTGAPNQPTADGIAFILHNDTKHVGDRGVGIGYRGIQSSLVIEFDTFPNGEEGDPDGNHIGININGDTKSIAIATAPLTLASGTTRHGWIEYDGSTKTLEVRVADSTTRPEVATLSHTIDLRDILQDSAYLGLTAGTGSLHDEHYIESLYFLDAHLPGGIEPPHAE